MKIKLIDEVAIVKNGAENADVRAGDIGTVIKIVKNHKDIVTIDGIEYSDVYTVKMEDNRTWQFHKHSIEKLE